MFELRELLSPEKWNKIKLVLIGGCRNEEDEKRVNDLKDLCKHFSIENNVEFRLNVPFEELCQAMQKASIGLHSMWNEHFGIAVVEMLAAGLITIAHRLVDYLFFKIFFLLMTQQRDRRQRALLQHQNLDFLFYLGWSGCLHKASTI